MAGYTTKYTGGNAALDEILKKQGQVYAENREKALAGDERAITAMRNANDAANQARNAAGYAAEYANDDIEYVKANAKPKTTSKPATSAPSTMQNYIEDMYKAQRENALAQLKSAYESNLNAINRAGQGIGQQYTNARNQTAGASELSARNFQEYAAAMGLNSGAGGQAELSRNIALQNDLSALDAQEASTVADLELRKTQAESDYNNAVAQAQSQNDAEKAAAMYKEMVRQEEAALAQELRDLEIARTERSNLADFGTAFLKNGTMPSPEMLAAMGMTQDDAQRYLNALAASKVVPTTTKKEEYKPPLKYDEVVAELAKGNRSDVVLRAAEYFGISPTNNETPGKGVDSMAFSDLLVEVRRQSGSGAEAIIDKYWADMNEGQRGTIINLMKQKGYDFVG